MNRFEFLGRIAHTPKINNSQSGGIVYRTSIAVDRKYKKENEENVDFFNITAFGKTAEFMQKYMNIKGIRILIEGHIQNRNWEDDEGKKHYMTDFIVDNCYFADSKTAGQADASILDSKTPVNTNNDFEVSTEDDLPF